MTEVSDGEKKGNQHKKIYPTSSRTTVTKDVRVRPGRGYDLLCTDWIYWTPIL